MNNDIKVQLCKDDFYLMMRNAVIQAGGTDNVSKWKQMRLDELVNLFAQNGIRIVHMPEKHMNSIKIVWEDPNNTPKQNVSIEFGGNKNLGSVSNATPPKKKQLLCDQKDFGEDEDWNELHT